jgi:hypothetical protein
MGKERVMLEDHVHRPAIGRNADHAGAGDLDVARGRLLEAGDEPERGRLAAAGRAEEGMEGTAGDGEAHPIDRPDLPVMLGDRVEADIDGLAGGGAGRGRGVHAGAMLAAGPGEGKALREPVSQSKTPGREARTFLGL